MQHFIQTTLAGPVTPDQLLSSSKPPQAFQRISTPVASYSQNAVFTEQSALGTAGFTYPPASSTMKPVMLTGHQRPSQVLKMPAMSQAQRINGGQYAGNTTTLPHFHGPTPHHAMPAARQHTSQLVNMPMMQQAQNVNYGHHNANMAGLALLAGPATPANPAFVANQQPPQSIAMPSTPSVQHIGQQQRDNNPVFYTSQEVELHFKTPQMWPTLSDAPFCGTATELAQKYPQMAPALDQVYRNLHDNIRSTTGRAESRALQQPGAMFMHNARAATSSAAFGQAQDMRHYTANPAYALPVGFATNLTGQNIAPTSQLNVSPNPKPTPVLSKSKPSPMKTIQCHAGTENAHLVNVPASWAKTRCPGCYDAEIALVSQYESSHAGEDHMRTYRASSRFQEMRNASLSRGPCPDVTFGEGEAGTQGIRNVPTRMHQGRGSHETDGPYRTALASKVSESRIDLTTTSSALRGMDPTTPQLRRAGAGSLQTTGQEAEISTFLCADCGLESRVDLRPSQNNGVHCRACCDMSTARGLCVWERASYDITVNGTLLKRGVQAFVFKMARSCRATNGGGASPCACTYSPKLVADPSHLPTTQMPQTRNREPPSKGSMPSMSNGTTPSPCNLSESITPYTPRYNYLQPSIIGPRATVSPYSLKRKRTSSLVNITDMDNIIQSSAKRTKTMVANPLATLDQVERKRASSPIVIDDDEDVEVPPVRPLKTTRSSKGAATDPSAEYSQPSPALLAALAAENTKFTPPSTAYSKPSPALLAALAIENSKNAPSRTAASQPGSMLPAALAVETKKIAPPRAAPGQPNPALLAALAVENKKVVPQSKKLPLSKQPKAAQSKSSSRAASVMHAPPQETTRITPEGFLVGPTMTSGPLAGYHQVLATNMCQPPPYSATPPIVRSTPPGPDAAIALLLEAYLPLALTHAREMQPVQLWAHGTCPTWRDFGEHVRHRDEYGKMRCRACDRTGLTNPGVLTRIHDYFASQV
ncbi:hypothetical protein LTR91_016189 [Friedmanniomyces endolithicus]|uniref:Uncharacterized protein n=1 Tax=Friedmanniomyces endolithicus TaxID=329885 RepID=A0AAN6K8L3_9PEZI|nr:hypothetical protein LTR59_015592 [Friedmanniomyces endolithicus]KAK0779025.1 hypothetical protein LTR38_014587 [Friedmanniomyces endolithicus]KAK0782461.1 hypothetical protein LTR75_014399 [Friedmanniomyces endolithicus]KAK0831307.1 hypothetical protein LTR03_015531 [Friedmanniomyces endolithicus]KAK0889295.1 hypothetical protein LTR02_015576 [Friedmanniomyces endolithicus]